MTRPLLLHSLVEHRAVVLACIDAVGPSRILEVGSETGVMTHVLHEWAAERDATLVSVDPDPAHDVRELAAGSPRLELVVGASPWALEGLDAPGVAILDGDHNYWTVSRELEALERLGQDADAGWLAVLHDVGWPWARRDLYYAPERLPPDAVHPHSFERGVAPGEAGLVRGGFRGEGQFAAAETEGGERNGVLTAIEDFAGPRSSSMSFRTLPGVFGVGVLYSSDQPWSSAVDDLLDRFTANPLLEVLEANRLDLFVAYLDGMDEVNRMASGYRRTLATQEERIEALSAENAALRLALARTGQAA